MQDRSPDELDDQVERACSGDEEALRLLLRAHEGALLARIRHRLHPATLAKVDAEDVLQDVYLVVARRIRAFRERSAAAFRVWLHRIADFKVREAMRRYLDASSRDVRRERAPGARPNTSRFLSPTGTPSQEVVRGETAALARRAFERLPADYRCVLQLAQGEGTSLREIATLMGRSYEAVKKLYGRAVARFKSLLDEESGRERG